MGAACCVAAKDKTVRGGSTREILHRNVRCSPTWSFRWDHPGRVAGEDASITWFSDGISRNDGSENKNESSYVSEDGSPLQSDQRNRCKKYPISEGSVGHVINSTSDQSISTNVSMDVNVEQVKGLEESSTISCPSTKPSSSLPSTSLSASPLPSQSHLAPSSSTPSRWSYHSPGDQLLRQVSDSQVPGFKSRNSFHVTVERPVLPSWSNESGMHSCVVSSDGWSVPGSSELMGTSHKERWSFDSESFGFNQERLLRSSSRFSTSPVDLQTCGVCSKLLTEKSSWSSQKIIVASNDLAVVSVLICGHVYHAECLESMTPEINKYDPVCPVCTFGEKQTLKLSQKALKAEMDLKARNKKSKNRIVDSEIGDDFVFDHFKDGRHQVKGPRMGSSSSGRSSFGKPFLRRHFSFGSKSSKSMLDSHPTRKKGFFWAKSSKQ
ncbi:putative transcription factor C2H2 family [Lupinus albus]|uniref:Putative transcription factor C2H2 family n=1 Tax=Lupinus albus TaxID=3870 RepID=A0A6A4QTL7_LUPAL|nr:putative transcription factor C2H2 family [Lupinus albus]